VFARQRVIAVFICSVACTQAEAAPEAAAELGKPAPDFTLTDTDGVSVKLSALRGKTVVLEWFNPDCPFVKHAHGKGPLKDLAKRMSSDKLVWLTINSNAVNKQGSGLERNRAAKVEYGFTNRLLLDESGKVGHAYGAIKTPHIFVIDVKGVLVYRGGLDNAPVGVVDDDRPRQAGTPAGTLVPYLENALSDMSQSKKLRQSDTPAYGCTVKYAD
jgi:peroxiredoxin